MIKKFLACISCLLVFVACSDKDEPKVEDFKYEPLEQICGNQTWVTKQMRFFSGNDEEISIDRVIPWYVGGSLCVYFKVENNTITVYYDDPSTGFDEDRYQPWEYSYRFDRNNGYIYLNNEQSPEYQIISCDDDQMVIRTYFGNLICYGMLPEYDGIDVNYGDPDWEHYNAFIPESYAEFILKPGELTLGK